MPWGAFPHPNATFLFKGYTGGTFSKTGGMIHLHGMLIALVGVAGCGWAGYKKENDSTGCRDRPGRSGSI
jgi:hypothetical protein